VDRFLISESTEWLPCLSPSKGNERQLPMLTLLNASIIKWSLWGKQSAAWILLLSALFIKVHHCESIFEMPKKCAKAHSAGLYRLATGECPKISHLKPYCEINFSGNV